MNISTETTSIAENLNTNIINVYPNPVNDKLIVDIKENIYGEIHIFNSLGQIIFLEDINGSKEIVKTKTSDNGKEFSFQKMPLNK